MKINNKHSIRGFSHLSRLGILSILLILLGCVNDDTLSNTNSSDTAEINLSISSSTSLFSSTRSNSDIVSPSKDALQILVFETLDNGTEVFSYKPEIIKQQYNGLVIRVKTSKPGQKFRFVVLANAGQQVINENQSKSDVLKKFTFYCTGKWKTDGTQLIPMWGESLPMTIDRDKSIGVLLNLALAKVDIGLNFVDQDQDNQSNEVHGLNNFKLTSARVYRTKNKAYVGALDRHLNANGVVVKPNMPTAKFNLPSGHSTTLISVADQNPLLYAIDLDVQPQGDDRIVNQIYIPESFQPTPSSTMDDVPCIVIGGYFGTDNIASSSPVETFYRVDFANYKLGTTTVESYNPILRNNRYVFNITAMTNPGYSTEEQALKGLPIDMELDLQVWNVDLMNFKVQGAYFFSVENRDVVIPTADLSNKGEKPSTIKPGQENYVWAKVAYKTNIPQEDWIKEWVRENTEDALFEFVIEKDYLWFGSKPNVSDQDNFKVTKDIKQRLKLKMFETDIDIRVIQEAKNIIFSLDCDNIIVNGKYRSGGTLNYTHNIELTIYAPTDLKAVGLANESEPYTLVGEDIHIFTPKRKGIYFEFKDKIRDEGIEKDISAVINGQTKTIKVREYKVELEGKGTPVLDPHDLTIPDTGKRIKTIDDLAILTNSVQGFGYGSLSCETTVVFGYNGKKILAVGSNASWRFGYMLTPNSGSRAFIDSSMNFGIDPTSTVTMEQFDKNYIEPSARDNAFHIKVLSSGSKFGNGFSGYQLKNDKLVENITNFSPDIILIGYAISFTDEVINTFDDYVNRGGVLIMFTEYYPSSSSVSSMLNKILKTDKSGANDHISGTDMRFELPSGDKYKDDPILNGPFGDLRGKEWGSDGHSLFAMSKGEYPDTQVYNESPESGPCFLRYTGKRTDGSNHKKAFIFNGDGGFISNSGRYIGPKYSGMSNYCPFAIDAAYRPIPRTNFKGSLGIYNSQIFGNILAWAVDYAEEYGINLDK